MKDLASPEVRDQTVNRIRALPPDARRRWGRMSAHQMLCHLNDSFLGVLGERPIHAAGSLAERTVVKWIALYAPMQWPKGVQTRPEVNQEIGGTPPADWERDRAHLLESIARFTSPAARLDAHPIFGRLTRAQWMRWGYLHVDHHLRQFGA